MIKFYTYFFLPLVLRVDHTPFYPHLFSFGGMLKLKKCSQGHYKRAEQFIGARGQECKLCQDCRDQSYASKKRKIEADPEWWEEEKQRVKTLLWSLVTTYKSRAKSKGIEWALPDEYAWKLFQLPCFYCRKPPVPDEQWSGIDRFQNTFGYLLSNSVPCCAQCNTMKLGKRRIYPKRIRPCFRRLGYC